MVVDRGGEEHFGGAKATATAEAGGEAEDGVVDAVDDEAPEVAEVGVPGDFAAVDGEEGFVTGGDAHVADLGVVVAVGVGKGGHGDVEILFEKDFGVFEFGVEVGGVGFVGAAFA